MDMSGKFLVVLFCSCVDTDDSVQAAVHPTVWYQGVVQAMN